MSVDGGARLEDNGAIPVAPVRPSSLEIATGWIGGRVDRSSRQRRDRGTDELHGRATPFEALEQRLTPLLGAGRRCYVSFSGGHDSSSVLSVAVDIARRHGLPMPIPVTYAFPAAPETREDHWQELVVRRLGLEEWIRLEFTDELDVLGPSARASLLDHGLLWPAPVVSKGPFLDAIRGGYCLTGQGGDEVLGPTRLTALRYIMERRGPIRRGVLGELVRGIGPRPARKRLLLRTRHPDDRAWLTPEARAAYLTAVMGEDLDTPLRWDRAIRQLTRRRGWLALKANMAVVAQPYDVTYVHPLMEDRFLFALTSPPGSHRHTGFAKKSDLMRWAFGGAVPEAVLQRSTKVHFNAPFAGRWTRQFAAAWDGSGVDTGLIDPDRLRAAWMADLVHGGTFTLLQSAWLASVGAVDMQADPA